MLESHFDLFLLYSILAMICMVSATFLCICGCKAKERKDELVGIEGHVKMTNPEVVEVREPNGHVVTGHEGDRDRGASTAKRSLPDLPVGHPSGEIAAADVSWEPSADTASELYATVGIQKCAKHEDLMTPLTPSDHPYDKLKSVEHPYAQVNKVDGPSTSHDAAAGSAPPISPLVAPPRLDIAAATAIAGHVQASDDLPYMTPPTHFSGDSQDSAKGYTSISVREPLSAIRAETAEARGAGCENRGHYATLSDDSDDMYAAIEEPTSGSETYAQIGPPPPPPAPLVPTVQHNHAHTHSRQESSSSAASSSAVASPKPEKRQANSPLPAPPAAGLPDDRNLDDMYAKVNKIRRREIGEDVLERGASTESAMSGSSDSVSYKLQSNPTSTSDSSQSHSCHGQSTSTSTTTTTDSSHPNSRELQQSPSNDDSFSSDPDMRCYESLGRKDPGYESLEKKDPGYETLDKRNLGYKNLDKRNTGYECLRRTSDPGYETLNNGDERDNFVSEPNYATLSKGPCYSDPNYATLGKGPPSDSDPNYATFGKGPPSDSDPNYATLGKGPPSDSDPNYATLGKGPPSDSDPNYATLGKGPPSDSDPNYERIDRLGHDYASLHRKSNDGYATVNKDGEGEPAYDSLKSHLYATVVKHKNESKLVESRSEPPYASLCGDNGGSSSDPDYESVEYSRALADPPYQLLADFESGTIRK